MTYLCQDDLDRLGFKSLGKNVLISDKASIYNADQIEIGDNSRVDDFCVLSGRIKIGRFSHVTPMCLIAGGEPGVHMSDFCTLAYGVKIFSQSDDYSGETLVNSLINKKYKKEIFEAVTILKHVVLGAGSIVMPGVVIAEGCSFGAMTLVNKNTDPWSIYFGVPARKYKDRSKNMLDLEKLFLKEINNDPI